MLLPSMDNNNNDDVLHVVMFPWLAMGHLIPFLELSKHLAQKGHRVSFVSTPRNIKRLPKIPPNLSPLINLVDIPLPKVNNLPENAESSTDVPIQRAQCLKIAFDGLENPLTHFLQDSDPTPDWIICDYASHWLPKIAAKLGVPCAFFSLFNAAALAFFGSPSELLSNTLLTPEDFTIVPQWVPFPSDIVYRFHELLQYFEGAGENDSGVSDPVRFGFSIRDSDFVALRSCVEFEPDWIKLLKELFQKPVIPIGLLPPSVQDVENEEDEKWVLISDWLNKQKRESVVFVALGSEATLSREQVSELALGLELSELPFFWVLRKFPGSTEDESRMLPQGFEDRTKGRGMVYMGWAPQVRILANSSVGGFLTHCGWNSVIEGLSFGRPLILLPVLNDQGLNARLLQGKKLGLEIPRNERDGWFTRDSVAESIRVVMVSEEGESFRSNVREMGKLLGHNDVNERHAAGFVKYLREHKTKRRDDVSATI